VCYKLIRILGAASVDEKDASILRSFSAIFKILIPVDNSPGKWEVDTDIALRVSGYERCGSVQAWLFQIEGKILLVDEFFRYQKVIAKGK
jgi:hypothetical protein